MSDAKRKPADPDTSPTANDTISAISTPPGPGAIGVVRISGPSAVPVGTAIFTPVTGGWKEPPTHRRAVVGRVHPPDEHESPIDKAVWLFFEEPRSYTGESLVEISVHGGPLILAEVLQATRAAGARLAEPGEFTRRAFLNGRMDLSQAEAVASLIFAGTEKARRVMLRQVEGAMGKEAGRLRKLLLEAKVILEIAIDFSEDVHGDSEDEELAGLKGKLEGAQGIAERLLGTSRQGIALEEGLKVAIIGAPNVGKSSLLNALLEEERAIVHEVAGTTRDFIEGRISVEGIPMVVVDTAGIRNRVASVEEEGIRRTRSLMEGADMLMVVLDVSRKIQEDEARLLADTSGFMRVVVANKCDLPAAGDAGLPGEAVEVSALTGQGMEGLKKAVYRTYLGGETVIGETGGVVTTIRQAEALRRIRAGCSSSIEGLASGHGAELLAVGVDEALMGVGELTGEVTSDEVLNTIFERFCIGK